MARKRRSNAASDFKNGGTHWLRMWPVLAFLLIQTAAGAWWASSLDANVSKNSEKIDYNNSELSKRAENVYAIPRIQKDITEIKNNLNTFQQEYRKSNLDIREILIEIKDRRKYGR